MIRILYVADSLMAGGIESQLVELLTRLDRTRFEPFLVCLYGPRARDLHFAPHIQAANIPLYTPDLGWSAWDKVKAVAHIVSVAWKVRPHLIQAEGYHANLLTRLAWPLLPPTKLIGTVRGLHTAKQLFYERLSHWMCSRMIVNAPHLKAMLAQGAHVPADKISLILNGINVQRYAQPHDRNWRQTIAPDSRLVFVSLGRISFEKSMHHAVEGFGLLKRQGFLPSDVRFFIVGAAQEVAAQQALDEAIKQDGLEAPVIQHPATSHPEDYYHACDVCILYSPAEGLPNVSIEALASGRPVLISDAANAAQVIEDKVTGWVVRKHDASHLAETLQTILATPPEALAHMQAACFQAAQRYTAESMVQGYTDLYQACGAAARHRAGLFAKLR
jgi:glycosyltransferase involved in cell wall biosynthesis